MSATLTAPTLPPISLEELDECAALQKRFDSKFLLSASEARALPEFFPHGSRALQIGPAQSFSYCSIYFDTPDLKTYTDAAHGRRRRFKVRTRAYCDSGLAYLEVKIKLSNGSTKKVRLPHSLENLPQLGSYNREFIMTALLEAGLDPSVVPELEPALMTGFDRSTYLVPDGRGPLRVTIDTGLYWEGLNSPALGQEQEQENNILFRPSLGIVEVKSPTPSNSVNLLLQRRGIRRSHISKYCTGTAALNPRLPSNRWHRTLKKMLLPQTNYNNLQDLS